MFTLTHPKYSPITVLGYAVNYQDHCYDMREPDWKNAMRFDFGNCEADDAGEFTEYHLPDYYQDESDYADLPEPLFLEYLFVRGFVAHSDWGSRETAFDAIDSSIETNKVLLAMNGKRLDELVCDESVKVLQAVAKYGDERHKDKLIHHLNWNVRYGVISNINGCTSEHIGIFLKQGSLMDFRAVVQHHKDCAKKNIAMFAEHSDLQVQRMLLELIDIEDVGCLIDSKDAYTRMFIAKRGKREHLAKLAHDESPWIREMVAKHSEFHDILINDDDKHVLETIIKHEDGAKYHARLATHKNPEVRQLVARVCGKQILTILSDDEYPEVRIEVARRGASLDKLLEDSDPYVRAAAIAYPADLSYSA